MQKILGIDIGSYSVKVAEIERDMREFHLVGFYEQPMVASESLGKEVSAAQAITRIFEEYNLPTQNIYTAIPGQNMVHRLLELPFSDFKKVDQTIEFEMESFVPLPLEELLIDYEFLSASKGKSTALVSYVKKSDFIKFLNITSEVDLDPRHVGSEVVEMANVMKLGGFQPDGTYAVLDIGHEKTNVLIFSGNKLQFARTIMVGGKDLTLAVAESMNIPFLEAERMKIEMGQLGPEVQGADAATRNVSQAFEKPLEELLVQVKQTFMGFQEIKNQAQATSADAEVNLLRQPENVQAILLCGGTSRLPGIDHYLSSRLRKNVSFLDCLDFPFNQLSDSEWCRPIAATALSLAYRGVLGSNIRDIQFRRGEFAYKGETREVAKLATQAGVLVGVILFFAVGSLATSYVSLKGKAKSQTARISQVVSEAMPDLPNKNISNPSTVLSMLTGKITEAEEKKKKIEEETKLSILEVLKEFSASLPPRDQLQVDVDDLTIAARRIRLQGKTTSFEAIDQIKTALTQSKFFKNVATENVKKGLKDEIRFNLSLEVAGEGEGDVEGGGNGA